jgi:site-specific recombinase XerD
MKFKEATKSYLKQVEVRESPNTFKKLKGYLRRTNQFMGDYDCSKIDRNILLDFIIHRRNINPEVSNTTLNIYILYIQVVLREEVDMIVPFKKLREEKKIPQILSDVVIKKVYDFLDSTGTQESVRNKLMFMMLLDTGLRISELLNISIDDINFISNIVRASKTKNKEHRQVLITDSTKNMLLEFIGTNKIKSYIFINLTTRRILHSDSIQTICKRIQKKAKINQSITPHKWRHTFASRFIDNDGNQFVLMKLLGHKKITTTQIYVQVSMKKVKEEYFRIFGNAVK